MSYSLNSLNGGYIGEYLGGLLKGILGIETMAHMIRTIASWVPCGAQGQVRRFAFFLLVLILVMPEGPSTQTTGPNNSPS